LGQGGDLRSGDAHHDFVIAHAEQRYFLTRPDTDRFHNLQSAARVVAVHAGLQASQSPQQCGHQGQHQGKAAEHSKQVGACKSGCHGLFSLKIFHAF
jgi:hypothetical protein